jgi:glycylpeptide N-tetradecanoyltransferase
MVPADVPSACRLLNAYLSKYHLATVFDEHDFAHWLLPRADVIYAYVAENPATKEISELISFYHLPSSILKNPKHTHLKAAYSYYHVNTLVSYKDLMHDALTLAAKVHCFSFARISASDTLTNPFAFFMPAVERAGGL